MLMMRHSLLTLLTLGVFINACGQNRSEQSDVLVEPGFANAQTEPLQKFFDQITIDLNYSGEREFHNVHKRFEKNCVIKFRATFERKSDVTRLDRKLGEQRKLTVLSYKLQLLAFPVERDLRDVGAFNSKPWGSNLLIPYSIYLEMRAKREAIKSQTMALNSDSEVEINAAVDYRYLNSPLYDSSTKKAQDKLQSFMLETGSACFDSEDSKQGNTEAINPG